MNRGDKLEGQIRAVLAAEASTRRVVAVRTPTRGSRLVRQALFFGSRTVPATLLIILVAVAAGLGLADWRAQRTPSDQSQATAGTPGPLALGGGAPSPGFGLISTSANLLAVRSEADEKSKLVIPGGLPQVAVSPNGKDVAYWLGGNDPKTGETYFALHVTDVIDAIGAADANGRLGATVGLTYLTSSAEVPFAVLWSTDGTGVLAGTRTPNYRGVGVAPTPHTSWFAIDLASRKIDRLAPGFESVASTVYAWDRQRDIITGSGLYAGRTTFTSLQGGRITNSAIPTGAMIGAADTYGRSLVLAYAGSCKGVVGPANCPTLEVRDQATFATITTAAVAEPTTDYPDVVFRPRSQDLIIQLPLPNGRSRVELWGDLGQGPHQVLASYSQSGRFTARRELLLPRVDGSAVFLLKFDDSSGGRWFGEIVALAPDSTNRGGKDPQRTPFEIRTGGNPLASVVLDPAFARAMDPRLSASPKPSPSSSLAVPSTRPAEETPVVSILLNIGDGPGQPGVSAPGPGGIPARGPTSFAVDDQWIYLWDQAHSRILIYGKTPPSRAIPVAASSNAFALEVSGTRLYLRDRVEYEIDAATGAILRTYGPSQSGGPPTIYPRSREQYLGFGSATKGPGGAGQTVGTDERGNHYERFVNATCSTGAAACVELRRVAADGRVVAFAGEPIGAEVVDYYVTPSGAVYELRNDRAPDGRLAGVFIVRLLAAIP